MRNRLLSVLVLSLVAIVLWYHAPAGQAQPAAKGSLPGARPTIEAIAFPNLQAAIDALPPTGGELHLPAGTFEISQPLVISQEDVLIRGAGTATHIKNINEDGEPAIVIQAPGFPEKKDTKQWRVKLEDLRVTGNPKSGDGIAAHKVDEIFLEGVTVSYHGGHGILLDHCYEDPRVCDCLITYNKQTGLFLVGCHDIVVASTHFEENQDALRCHDGFNLCMSGCNLDDHLRHGVVIENTYGSVVSGNMIEECNGIGIVLDRDCYGITLSANVIAHEVEGGIDLRDAHGCAVSANTFTIVKQKALRIGPDSSRITVTGNNFSDSNIGGSERRAVKDQQASGLVLEGTSDITVSGNLFSGLTTPAVELAGDASQRILFSGNVLTEVESQHAKLKGKVEGNLE